ncbi:MAG: hypothetical protein R3B84_01640 [Zavarzinella sp.]
MKVQKVAIGIAFALILTTGVLHGMWTNRWSGTTKESELRAPLAQLDQPLAGWVPGKMIELNPQDLPADTNTESRAFSHPAAKGQLVASLTAGKPGVVAAHTPDVCYLGSGYQLQGSVGKKSFPGSDGTKIEMYQADFVKTSASNREAVRVLWTWHDGKQWRAPDYPRLTFFRTPIVYKLYIVQPVTEGMALTETESYRNFVTALATELGQQLTK